MKRPRILIALLLVTVLLVIAGCSGQDEPIPSDSVAGQDILAAKPESASSQVQKDESEPLTSDSSISEETDASSEETEKPAEEEKVPDEPADTSEPPREDSKPEAPAAEENEPEKPAEPEKQPESPSQTETPSSPERPSQTENPETSQPPAPAEQPAEEEPAPAEPSVPAEDEPNTPTEKEEGKQPAAYTQADFDRIIAEVTAYAESYKVKGFTFEWKEDMEFGWDVGYFGTPRIRYEGIEGTIELLKLHVDRIYRTGTDESYGAVSDSVTYKVVQITVDGDIAFAVIYGG